MGRIKRGGGDGGEPVRGPLGWCLYADRIAWRYAPGHDVVGRAGSGSDESRPTGTPYDHNRSADRQMTVSEIGDIAVYSITTSARRRNASSIDARVALAALHFLVCVIPARADRLGGFDAPAVKHGG